MVLDIILVFRVVGNFLHHPALIWLTNFCHSCVVAQEVGPSYYEKHFRSQIFVQLNFKKIVRTTILQQSCFHRNNFLTTPKNGFFVRGYIQVFACMCMQLFTNGMSHFVYFSFSVENIDLLLPNLFQAISVFFNTMSVYCEKTSRRFSTNFLSSFCVDA